MAFHVGDRVRVRADAPLRNDGNYTVASGALAWRRGRSGVIDSQHVTPGWWIVVFDDGSMPGMHEDDLEMDPAVPPSVLDRFAELAKDPAMLPVLEAAVDFFEAARNANHAVAKSGASSNAFQLALQRFMGAEC